MDRDNNIFSERIAILSDILEKDLAGFLPCSEFELLKQLRDYPQLDFLKCRLGDNLSLFQGHFIIFHVLYSMRDDLWQKEQAYLEINPLNISLLPYQPEIPHLVERDPIRDYYMDISELVALNEQDVENMLEDFWALYDKRPQRKQALGVLGLVDPVDEITIRKRYRRLAMEHHPDRGGDEARIQELNLAMKVLKDQ